jgi:hypothetical protein
MSLNRIQLRTLSGLTNPVFPIKKIFINEIAGVHVCVSVSVSLSFSSLLSYILRFLFHALFRRSVIHMHGAIFEHQH